MNKYLTFITIKFQASLQYRSELILWVFINFIPYFLLFFVFNSLYKDQTTIRGLTLTNTLEYFFIASIIQGLTATHFESWRSQQIRLGKIDFFLIRPFSYLHEIILYDVAMKLFYIFIFIPINLFFFFFVQYFFEISLFSQLTLSKAPVVLLLLFCAYVIQMFLASIITFLTFWFEGAEGLQHFKWVVLSIFSGGMIPIEFMPNWLSTVVTTLPFRYVYAVPIGVIQNRYAIEGRDIVLLVTTIVLLFLITKLLLRIGIHKYSSAGG